MAFSVFIFYSLRFACSIGKGYGKNESVSKKESDTVEEKVITELPAPKALPNDTLGNPISSRIPGTLSILKTEDLNQLSESIWDFFVRIFPLICKYILCTLS